MTKIVRINPLNPEKHIIKEAADVIRKGGTVAFPTETVYGIGADAFNGSACARIFEAKGRPADNPLIVHISNLNQLKDVAREIPEDFMNAARILWPGPVTFILKKNSRIPDEVSAGHDTVAVRMPAHPVALRLIEESGTLIAAPSANTSQKPSATSADHVRADLDGKIDMILDGGDTAFGIESTIINMTVKPHILLRPGSFTIEELEKYLGNIIIPEGPSMMMYEAGAPVAPGMKYRHYAPDKRLVMVVGDELLVEASEIAAKRRNIAVLCSNDVAEKLNKGVKVIRLGNRGNLYEIAKNLFDAFRRLDRMDIETAFVQTFPERGMGLALMNRISKASAYRRIDSIKQLDDALQQT